MPPPIIDVATAIPAFIGHTEKAERDVPGDLTNRPVAIRSPGEFEQYFGRAPKETIDVDAQKSMSGGSALYTITRIGINTAQDARDPDGLANRVRASYLLAYAVQLFFHNGGITCYIVSVGDYSTPISDSGLNAGLEAIALEDGPTLLVVPDAIKLTSLTSYARVTAAMLAQCSTLKDRFAILDLWEGYKPPGDIVKDAPAAAGSAPRTVVDANREMWTGELQYGAAYYPFLETSLNYEIGRPGTEETVTVRVGGTAMLLKDCDPVLYAAVTKALREQQFVVMPPSSSVAGAYATIDRTRGVWKAPANVALSGVRKPTVAIDEEAQRSLNIDVGGKSVNVLRSFAGQDTLVWGARTLAGNHNDWRYVPVRRFFIMVERSVGRSTRWAVFERNDANTWAMVRGVIENYLTQKWRDGALAGTTAKDAFFVRCGLGTSMTAQDIAEGRLSIEIGMAVVRPAEFIVVRLLQQLQPV